jgi:tetratricopeptide (TPR) repeat protein
VAAADYSRICFVAMPFGKVEIGATSRRWYRPWRRPHVVDFDFIYENVFRPAIDTTPLPEPGAGYLTPHRCDQEFVSGIITAEMYQLLEYSRFTLVDITGLNFNVAYELGHRHRAHASGTAIFRQPDTVIPFDIGQTRVFSYDFEPSDRADESRQLITRVLTESLRENRLDSPVQAALRQQQAAPAFVENGVRDAENAIRQRDWGLARVRLEDALREVPDNAFLCLRLGLVFKEQGDWTAALHMFERAVTLAPTYAEAYRELGIAENKLQRVSGPDQLPGEQSLRRALKHRPADFDALASLGGILKRAERYDEALAAYTAASDASFGHAYPLINQIILQAHIAGVLKLTVEQLSALRRASRVSATQASARPPYNAPWSHFDLATARLLEGNYVGFGEAIENALEWCTAAWHPMTFRRTLELLPPELLRQKEVSAALASLDEYVSTLPPDR